MGRPKKVIDPEIVRGLAQIGATLEDMAVVLGCNERTLRRRFVRVINEGRAHARTSLRKWQWEKAKAGSPAMLIWLGKQMLGQQDRVETTTPTNGQSSGQLADIPSEQLDREIERLQLALRPAGQAEAVGAEATAGDPAAGEGAPDS